MTGVGAELSSALSPVARNMRVGVPDIGTGFIGDVIEPRLPSLQAVDESNPFVLDAGGNEDTGKLDRRSTEWSPAKSYTFMR